jgi:thioredoxin reductase (NADPH)
MDFNLVNFSTGNVKQPENDQAPQHVKVLVLGSGPAGLAAALYAARAELHPIVLTGMEFGGQVSLTHTVENYPGFPDGVGGSQLVDLFQKQAERFGAVIEFDRATQVDLTRRPFTIQTDNRTILADTLIISTGATPRYLGIPGERELTGRGVSYCATCDGWFFKEKDVVVVGGGDSALEEGLFLTRYARSVTIIHRRDTLRAGAILQNRALNHPKMRFIWNTVLTEVVGEDAVKKIKLRNVVTNEISDHKTDGVFIFIGHSPNTQLFEGKLEMSQDKYLIVDHLMKTSVPGVFAAGEVGDSHFKQVITSAGMGAAAAISANHFLEQEEN